MGKVKLQFNQGQLTCPLMVYPLAHVLQHVLVVGGCVGVYIHAGGCVFTLPLILQLMPVVKSVCGWVEMGGMCHSPPLPSPLADDSQWTGSTLRLTSHRERVV